MLYTHLLTLISVNVFQMPAEDGPKSLAHGPTTENLDISVCINISFNSFRFIQFSCGTNFSCGSNFRLV